MTPDYIREHVRRALEEGRSIGAALYRIEHRWKLPKPKRMQAPGPALRSGEASPLAGAARRPKPAQVEIRPAPIGVEPSGFGIVDLEQAKAPAPEPRRPARPEDAATAWDFEANVEALLEWSGAEGVARRLAALPHVTPRFIREHYRQAYENNQDVIMALYRIEHNEMLPELWIHDPRGYTGVKAALDEAAARSKAGRRMEAHESCAPDPRPLQEQIQDEVKAGVAQLAARLSTRGRERRFSDDQRRGR